MKIIRKDIEKGIYFKELTIGDVFKYENIIFLKTETIINYGVKLLVIMLWH